MNAAISKGIFRLSKADAALLVLKNQTLPLGGVRLHTRERKDYATASMKCSRLSRALNPFYHANNSP